MDTTHPVDLLEPEGCEEPERALSAAQFRRLVIRIARTFFTGEPKITVVAWRIADCRDEAEALPLVAALRRAEETVTVKRLRESRLRDEFAAIVRKAEFAHFEVTSATEAMLNDLLDAAIQPFRDLLLSLQPEEDNSTRDDATKVVLKSLAPAAHVEDLLKMLRDACRSVGVATSDPYGPAKGLQTALEITDAILARLPEVNSERKRFAAACAAFRNVLAKA